GTLPSPPSLVLPTPGPASATALDVRSYAPYRDPTPIFTGTTKFWCLFTRRAPFAVQWLRVGGASDRIGLARGAYGTPRSAAGWRAAQRAMSVPYRDSRVPAICYSRHRKSGCNVAPDVLHSIPAT